MAYKLRKPTELVRATLLESARVIVAPEAPQSDARLRRITILTPESPACYFALDLDPFDVGGDDRNRMMRVPTESAVPFLLLTHQQLIGSSSVGIAEVSVLVEYLEVAL